jgi:hypothetical protein
LLGSANGDLLEARRHFLAPSPLIEHQLVHLLEDPQQPQSPLLARILKPDDRIVEFLFDIDEIDTRLRDAVTVVTPRFSLDDLLLEEMRELHFAMYGRSNRTFRSRRSTMCHHQ